jgi:hypothetical protein
MGMGNLSYFYFHLRAKLGRQNRGYSMMGLEAERGLNLSRFLRGGNLIKLSHFER